MSEGGIEYEDRDAGLHWFDHAAWIARCRIRCPHLYSDHAKDFVDVLSWAFTSWYRHDGNPDARSDGTLDEDTQQTTQTKLVTDGGRPDHDIVRDLPGNAKAAAVEQWKTALDELPRDAAWAEVLRSADIHDETDRRKIEEIIEHEVPEAHYLPLRDALDDLHTHFEGWWS